MTKYILILCLLFSGIITAQTEEKETNLNQNKHEIKLNSLMLLVGAFEGYYEYILNEESSIGASVFFTFSDDLNNTKYLSPYYRVFFGKKHAAGFFFEGFGVLNSYEYKTTAFLNGVEAFSTSTNNTDFALGLGIGSKWITKRNIVFEINAGIGRNLFNSNDINNAEIVGKFGLNVGYRF